MENPLLAHAAARRTRRPVVRLLVAVTLIAGPPLLAAWYALVSRPAHRNQVVDRFLAVDAENHCCDVEEGSRGEPCARALEDLVALRQAGDRPVRPLPGWVPGAVRDMVEAFRIDDAATRAAGIFERCPAAQELVDPGSTAADRLCGVMATADERELLARDAARRGTLIDMLVGGHCSDTGFDAGLARIQLEFAALCAQDACLEVLLTAPAQSRARVQDVVAAHGDAVLTALEPRLSARPDGRTLELLAFLLGPDAGGVAPLLRGDVSEAALTAALDLLQLPLQRRTAMVLGHIRSRADGPASAVAALILDAGEIDKATEAEIGQALTTLQKRSCAHVERVVQLLDLGYAERADAALPALLGCPEAARSILPERYRLSLTRPVLEAAFQGRFGDVESALIDRLDDGSDAHLADLQALATRKDIGPTVVKVMKALSRVTAARQRAIDEAVEAVDGGRATARE
jgi:hypothetical protein